MGQLIETAQAVSAGKELELVAKDEVQELRDQLAELEEQYTAAIVLLRAVKTKADRFARSGNPGRKNAGLDILQVMGVGE